MDTTPAPVAAPDRIVTLDVIRGFALLGILGPNILAFAWPSSTQFAPEIMGFTLELTSGAEPHERANELGHRIVQIVFHGKMMFLFSLLFGAGVLMYARKFDRKQDDASGRPRLSKGAGLWYTRCAWLLGIGLLHAFGLWYGDILVWYAIAGLGIVWWVRRLRPGWQFGLGAGLYLLGTGLLTGFMLLGMVFQGGEAMLGDYPGELAAYTGSYLDGLKIRAGQLLFTYIFLLPMGFGFSVTGLMTLGMALTKTGVLTGERSDRFYLAMGALGLTVGLTLTIAFLALLDQAVELPGFIFLGAGQLVGIPTALGYASVLILLVRRGWLRPVTAALASVGRMALSNYLLQTILCTTLFYGYALGLFGRVQYPQLWLVVAGVWTVNIVFSLLWLRAFRFGPAEWVWRSLTYLRPQPMLRAAPPTDSP